MSSRASTATQRAGLNRTRVELKQKNRNETEQPRVRLNRTRVELKRIRAKGLYPKSATFESNQSGIETQERISLHVHSHGLNRTRVELKRCCSSSNSWSRWRLNRTRVELKHIESSDRQRHTQSFESNQSGIETRIPSSKQARRNMV